MISLDAATVLLQWAVGGLFWLWVTTRRREVGLGYGWLLRSVFLVLAIGSFAVGVAFDTVPGARGLDSRRDHRDGGARSRSRSCESARACQVTEPSTTVAPREWRR